jgi:outer membrane protein OmpA-like peptidoglycan-associated protein
MQSLKKGILLVGVLLLITAAAFAQKDVAGSQDHSLITRYPGSVIVYYDQQKFDEYQIALGKLISNPDKNASQKTIIEKTQLASGKVTRIQYLISGIVSALEVFRNYQQALEEAGFETLLFGKWTGPLDIAGTTWSLQAYAGLENSFLGQISDGRDRSRRRYLAAKLAQPEGDVYVTVLANQKKDDEVRVQLDIIETQPMEGGLIKVDAETWAKEITRTGHVAIYGIYFDFDSAVLKPESEPTLKEIAVLLRQNPELNLYVVGHTDMLGSIDYNMKLSKARAESVVKALVADHQVSADRFKAEGVGPLAPVAPNDTEGGRAKNRRVELVAQSK